MSKYTIGNLLQAIRNPSLFRGEFNRLGTEANIAYHRRFVDHGGEPVMERDWDMLVILDACRYDMFEAQHDLDGELHKAISLGSSSDEFIMENFSGKTFYDTVYITANPWVNHLKDGVFHAVIDLLRDETWDYDLRTVPPGTATEKTLQARERYPNKRIITHFIQPHFPFIGERGREVGIGRGVYGKHADDFEVEQSVWTRLRYGIGDLSIETVWEIYRENLDVTLPCVEQLVENLEEKIVVSADHGNLLGERIWPIPVKGFGHPDGLYVDELVEVPWHVIDSQNRPDITADPPSEQERITDEQMQNRLKHLGYR